ncbi:putative ribonuclease H-like domain-containing protein [Tanacetum coccineum]
MNNRNVCKNNSVRVKKCFVCGSKLHLIKDCDFYNCVDSVPCKSKAASVPAGSRNSSASVTADGSDPAASRNRPAVNSAGRPKPTERVGQPAGWSKRPAPVSAGRPVSAGWLNPAARPYFRPSYVHFNNMNWPNVYDPMIKGRWGTAGDPSTDNDIGIVDSGCSRSMTGNKEKLDDFVQVKGGIVKFGGGDGRISGKGTIKTSKLDFENVYYVEELQHFNLFSVSQICDKKNKVLFTDTDCLVLKEDFQLPDESQVVLRIPRKCDLYTFSISELQPEQNVTCLVAKASLDESTRWHRRMAHVNFKTINKLAKEGLVDGLPLKVFTNEHNCVACNKGKQHKASYKHISAVRLITETLQLLHMDLFGPTNIRSIDQKYYSLVVTDDFSRFTWTFFLGTKDETFYVLKEFIALIENQLNKKVKGIRCDNGTEFKNAKLIELCGEKGIKRDYSNPRTPQQNGVAERKNRTLIEAARTMLADSKLPTMFWTEAVSTACYAYRVYNLPNKRIEETLNLRFLEDKPNVQGIGHEWYFDLDYLTDSLGYTRFKTNINAGSQDTDSDSEVDEHVIVVPSFPSRAVLAVFIKHETAKILSQAEAKIRNQGVSADRDPASIDSADGVSASSTSAGSDPAGGNPTGSSQPAGSDPAGVTSVSTDFIPVHADESTLPPGKSLGSSENTTRFPVPSDVCMDQLSSGIFTSSSYDDDFSATLTNLAPSVEVNPVPTRRVNTIHPQSQILGDLASPLEPTSIAKALEDPDWVAAMQEEMQQFINQQVWKLVPLPDGKHAIGTKWELLRTRGNASGIVVRNNAKMDVRSALCLWSEIEKKCLQVKQLPDGTFISQDRYVKDMLTKFDMESVRTATTPYEAAKTKLKDETDPPVNVHLYRSMIGSLMYLTALRPDIMFAVSACSRHQVTPLTSHLNAVKKIFKYLKGQPKLGLWYPKDSPFQLEAYSDSDYAGSHGDRKSTTGGCQFLGRRLISWQCKKQTIVATSSKEAEYVAAASCCAQVLKIHTDDNVADLLTKAFDGPRFEYLVVHIGMLYILPADMLVSAGSTMILLVVILPAGCFVSAGSTMILLVVILPAGCFVSAGSTMILLVVILPAGCFVSAGSTMILLYTSAGGFISADKVCVPAVSMVSALD